MGRWTAVGVEVERPQRSADDDLKAGEDPHRILIGRGNEAKTLAVSTHLLPPGTECVRETSMRVPAPSLIWVHGRGSGDMMMDGVPGVRLLPKGCGRSVFPGSPPNSGVATGDLRELAAGIT